MATRIKTDEELKYTFKLVNAEDAEDTVTRTITIPVLDNENPTAEQVNAIKAAALSFAAYVVGSESTLVQPTNWRDSDTEEDEIYITTEVVPELTLTRRYEFTPDN